MSVADWFKTFCSNCSVSNATTISSRYKSITRRLNTEYWNNYSDTSNSLYVGSYGRNTAANGISDIDMTFRLPYSQYEKYNNYVSNGQSALLQNVKTAIEKTYSTTNMNADGQVIQVPFSDGIIFEVVPVFDNKDGSFTFPNANNGGSWKTTNPKAEIEAIRARNILCNKNLIPLCRMLRKWKEFNSVSMGGLLIDTLAYQFIGTWRNRDKSYLYYDFMCRDFFEFAANQSKDKSYWIAPGSGQYVWGGGFQAKAKKAHNLSLEAIDSLTNGYQWTARSQWREIFGTSFPS